MRNKLTVPWTARLALGRLFHGWRKKGGTKELDQRLLKEDDLDHLGAVHSTSMNSKKR